MDKINSQTLAFPAVIGIFGTVIGTAIYYKYSETILSALDIVEYLLLFCLCTVILGLITLVRAQIVPKPFYYKDIVKIIGDVEVYKEQMKKVSKISMKETSGRYYS